jgi:hypothetical protein
MASFFIAPHVINRSTLYLPQAETNALLQARIDKVDVAVLDALFDYRSPLTVEDARFSSGHPVPVEGGVLFDAPAIRLMLEDPACSLTYARDGLLLFDCDNGSLDLENYVTHSFVSEQDASLFTFADQIGLLDYQILYHNDCKITLKFDWIAFKSLADLPPRVAVTRIVGVNHARIVHLPTLALYETNQWHDHEVVRETFTVDCSLFAELDVIQLAVGWYDSSHPYAAQTDAASRIGDEVLLDSFTLEHRKQ